MLEKGCHKCHRCHLLYPSDWCFKLNITVFFKNATAFESKHDRVLKKHGQGSPKYSKISAT